MELKVKTNKGIIEGFNDGRLRKWFGIPFAKPPVGALRFKRAAECDPWEGVKDCKTMGPSPLQFGVGMMEKITKSSTAKSEDCLYANVWAPADAENCPVFVWIYGGANHTGEAAVPEYDLSSFAANGIVGVSFNYRLGPLGFYNFHELEPDFDSNCAVSDMIAAMKWVHENIAGFGGDPDNVTICGESAGGTAVYSLLASPAAKGYFQKAIAMSGLAGNVTTQLTHDLNNKLFFDAIGLDKTNAAKLRDLSYDTLLKGAQAVMGKSNDYHQGIFITGPVIDDLIPDYPWEMLAKGNAAGVKCLIGTCKNEGSLFTMMKLVPMNWADIESCLKNNDMEGMLGRFKEVYSGMKEKTAAQAWATDRMFWADAMRCALAQSRYADVYSYRFDFAPFMGKVMGIGATHTMDVGPGLNTYDGSGNALYKLTPKKKIKDIHDKLHGSFVAFAKTGSPEGAAGLPWKPFTAEKRMTMLIDSRCSMIEDSNRSRYDLWEPIQLYK